MTKKYAAKHSKKARSVVVGLLPKPHLSVGGGLTGIILELLTRERKWVMMN